METVFRGLGLPFPHQGMVSNEMLLFIFGFFFSGLGAMVGVLMV